SGVRLNRNVRVAARVIGRDGHTLDESEGAGPAGGLWPGETGRVDGGEGGGGAGSERTAGLAGVPAIRGGRGRGLGASAARQGVQPQDGRRDPRGGARAVPGAVRRLRADAGGGEA